MIDSNNVVVREETQPAVTPMQMINLAVSQGADIDKLEKLMQLQIRWEENEARKAYHVAFSAFKAEAVEVIKSTGITDGPLKGKKYADLATAVDAATPALSQHGLSATWKITKDEKDWIECRCTITHVAGHSESTSFGGPPDAGGAKNAMQARASTLNYLQRYTFLAVTGLAAKYQDDDGNGGDGLSAERRQQIGEIVRIMKSHIAAGAVDDAVLEGENSNLDGPEEWKFAWSFFDSKQRAAMKKANEAMRAARKLLPITEAQVRRLEAMISERNLDREAIKKMCYDEFAKDHFKDLSPDEYETVCAEVGKNSAPPSRQPSESPISPVETEGTVGAEPTDASLVTDIEGQVKRKKFDFAYDLARGIKDPVMRENTEKRIANAKEFVTAREAPTA